MRFLWCLSHDASPDGGPRHWGFASKILTEVQLVFQVQLVLGGVIHDALGNFHNFSSSAGFCSVNITELEAMCVVFLEAHRLNLQRLIVESNSLCKLHRRRVYVELLVLWRTR